MFGPVRTFYLSEEGLKAKLEFEAGVKREYEAKYGEPMILTP